MSNKLDFWLSVEKTDPSMTKNVSVSGQNRTTVDAQFKKKMITKAFGMYGLGWGVVANSEIYDRERYENGTVILNYRATAFYVLIDHDLNDEGKKVKCEFPIAAQIKEAYVTNGGNGYLRIDDEAMKKVRTDALTKGFTDLGFCADIHMGMFDDDTYVTSQIARERLEKQENQEKAARETKQKIHDYVNKEIETGKQLLRLENGEDKFGRYMNRIRDKVSTMCEGVNFNPQSFINWVNDLHSDAIAEFKQQQEGGKNEG